MDLFSSKFRQKSTPKRVDLHFALSAIWPRISRVQNVFGPCVLSGPFSNFGKSGGLPPEIVPGFSFSANFRKWSRKFFTIFREILIKIVKKLEKWEFFEFGSAELVLSSQIRVIRRKRAICLINPYLAKNFTFFQKFDHFLANFRKKSKNR